MTSPAIADLLLSEVDPAQWGAQIRRSFFPFELVADRRAPFMAAARMSAVARSRIAQVRASAHTASMDAARCEGVAHRHVKILWQIEGSADLTQGRHGIELPAGHWTVYEATRPYELHMSEHASFLAFLCEVDAHDGLDFLSRRVGGRAVPTEGGAAVALAALEAMNVQGDRLSPSSRSAAADLVSTLLCQQIQHDEGSSEASRRRSQEALLREAKHYVRQHLDRTDLSPDDIARALHVCRRTLYHAFETSGETPQALVQRMRLERCREVLAQSDGRGSSITQVALEYGFSDPAYFTRVFRRRFGHTPTQWRSASHALPN